jgi:hypothetical protein
MIYRFNSQDRTWAGHPAWMIQERFRKILGFCLSITKNSIMTLSKGSLSKCISSLHLKVTHSKPTWMCSWRLGADQTGRCVQISFPYFINRVLIFSKIKKFQLNSYKICLKPSKNVFLTMYWNKTSTKMLVIFYIFIKTIKLKFEIFSWAWFSDDQPLKDVYCIQNVYKLYTKSMMYT